MNTGDLPSARKYAFRLIFDSFADAAVAVDADRRIWLFNNRSEEIFGYKQIDMIGQTLERILIEPSSGLPDTEKVEATASAGNEDLHPGARELVGLRKDGTEFPVQATVSGYGLGREAIFAITFCDVTERRQVEKVTFQAKNLEAVGQLAGGAAHEFNNIFATILLSAELLQNPLGQDDKRLQKVVRAASRGSRLTRQLLAFSRRERLKPCVLNPCDLVEEIK